MHAFFSGLMITGGLIVAIGAQNAFVLKQGLLGRHIGKVVAVCWLCDVLLIGAGVYGVAALLGGSRTATALLAAAGGLFLLVYGLRSAYAAWRGGSRLDLSEDTARLPSGGKTVLTTLALTLLNPHAYIDTVVLIGGAAAPLPLPAKHAFLAGSLLASALWFVSIGYGSRLLLPLFRRPRTWQVLDGGIALMMLYLASGLFKQAWTVWQAV